MKTLSLKGTMKIAHWIPTGSTIVRWPVALSWLNMRVPKDAEKITIKGAVSSAKLSWNKAVRDFMASDAEWLFSTHDDVVFEPETLLHLLSWNKPLISALIFMRQAPIVPHIWRSYPNGEKYAMRINDTREWFAAHKEYIKFGSFIMRPTPPDSLVTVDFTSTSCTLIHRSVLEAMSKECGEEWFIQDDEMNGGGEDRRFFEIAARAGFPAYVDRSCVVGHLMGDIPASSADFIAWDSVSVFHETGEPINA